MRGVTPASGSACLGVKYSSFVMLRDDSYWGRSITHRDWSATGIRVAGTEHPHTIRARGRTMDAQHRDTPDLPATYAKYRTVDFKKDRKIAVLIQAIFIGVALLATAVALLFELPLASDWHPVITIVVTVLAGLVYMAAHEATHGLTLRFLTGAQPSYRLKFPFLTTSSSLYFTRRSIVITALAPCVIWGVVLLVALLLVPADARLMVYILLALNFAGSAGDYVEATLALRQPPRTLLQDDADRIHIFCPAH